MPSFCIRRMRRCSSVSGSDSGVRACLGMHLGISSGNSIGGGVGSQEVSERSSS